MQPYLVITGASRGIGYATAKLFLEKNFKVINLSRTACTLAGVTNIEIDLENLTATNLELQNKLAALLPEKAQICLVHNAAFFCNDTINTLDIKDLQRTLTLNVVVPAHLNQLLLPFMAPESSIIYIGSTFSEKAATGCASYITSKHALAGLMKATCQDLIGKNIHTCCICPGVTATVMLQKRFETYPELRETLTALSTQGRLIEPREIAETIWFSAKNPVMNGAMLHANLGQVER